MSEYIISYEQQCKNWHNDLLKEFEINNIKNLNRRLDEIENIVNEESSPYSLSNDHGIPVLDNDIDDYNHINFSNFKIVRSERSRLEKLCNANIAEHTTVSYEKCPTQMNNIDDYKKRARNKLNRWKPKVYGDYVFFQIIFINIYNHCYTIGQYHGWTDNDILQLFVKIFHKLLESKIRFEKTRDVPLIMSTAFSTNTKFRSSCEHFLTHCNVYNSWNDKTGSAKAKCNSFKGCLEKLMDRNITTTQNIILPPPIIISKMDIQENNRKCSGGYRYLIRDIIIKFEDKEGCDRDERISECSGSNYRIIEIIQEYHHYGLRFWTVTPEKPPRHRQRYRPSCISYPSFPTQSTVDDNNNNNNDDPDGDYTITTPNLHLPPNVSCPTMSIENIYHGTPAQYVDNRPSISNTCSIGNNSSISIGGMSEASTPTTFTTSTGTASIPRGININGVHMNGNRSLGYSPIRSQTSESPYQSPRHNPLHGTKMQRLHRGIIKSQRLQNHIHQMQNIQHQPPVFSRMSSAGSSLPDIDRLPIPGAGNLFPIKSGKEIDDDDEEDYIQIIPGQTQFQFQQPQIVSVHNNNSYTNNNAAGYGNCNYNSHSMHSYNNNDHSNHPNITRDLPAPRVVNYEGSQSRNGIKHLSQELPMPRQHPHEQRGMNMMMDDYNNSQHNNNGNIIVTNNNLTNSYDENDTQELHQQSQLQSQSQFAFPTSTSTNNWYNNWNSNEMYQQTNNNNNNNTSNGFNSNNNYNNYNNGNNQNGSGSNVNIEQRQFCFTNINNKNNNNSSFDHIQQLNSTNNYDNSINPPSNAHQFNQFDNNNTLNQCTDQQMMQMTSTTAPNIVYGNVSGINNNAYHNSNNNSNMINNNIDIPMNNVNDNNNNNTFLFNGRNSQRMQLHNFSSYN